MSVEESGRVEDGATRRQVLRGAAAGATGAALAVAGAGDALAADPMPMPTPMPMPEGPGAAEAPPAPASPAMPRFTDPLTWPDVIDGSAPITLAQRASSHRFSSGTGAAQVLGYHLVKGKVLIKGTAAAGYLGPTIVVPTGRATDLTVVNEISGHPLASAFDPKVTMVLPTDATSPRTAVHVHGGNNAPAHDGGPLDTFPFDGAGRATGPSRRYSYPNKQDAAGLWYHDHAMGMTRLNVYAGLAAGYLVRDTARTGIDTGSGKYLPAPPYEVPMVIQDRRFTASGGLYYTPAPWEPEFFGDTPVVNGTAYPLMEVARGVYRLRVYNGCNARFLRLRLRVDAGGANAPFWQIGSDGGLFNTPVQLDTLLLAPAERADLLVDFRALPAGATVTMTNDAAAPFPNGGGGPDIPEIMRFKALPTTGWAPSRPIAGMNLRPLRPVQRLDLLAKFARVRTHSLVEIANSAGDVLSSLLDNRAFTDTSYVAQPSRRNTLEVWEFVNATMDAHPIHLHQVQFQILDRRPLDATAYRKQFYDNATGEITPGTGPFPAPAPRTYLTGSTQTPAANERGWKDTVLCPPNMVTRIAVPFGSVLGARVAAPLTFTGDYVWHCHILEHEDNDMMQHYRMV